MLFVVRRSLYAEFCCYSDVRLVGSSLNDTGRLEVNYGGVWGTVCDDAFDYLDAVVVCNSLGFGFVLALSVVTKCHFCIISLLQNYFDVFV